MSLVGILEPDCFLFGPGFYHMMSAMHNNSVIPYVVPVSPNPISFQERDKENISLKSLLNLSVRLSLTLGCTFHTYYLSILLLKVENYTGRWYAG